MKEEIIQDLKIDEIIWIIFITLSILNIVGDEYLIDYYKYNMNTKNKEAKDIFTLSVSISLIIYLYLLYKRYKVYKNNKINNQEIKICGTRFFATILVVIATILFLYCQLEERKANNPGVL